MSTVRNDIMSMLKGNNKFNVTYPCCSCKHNFGMSSLGGNGEIRESMKGGARNWSINRVAKAASNTLSKSRAGKVRYNEAITQMVTHSLKAAQ